MIATWMIYASALGLLFGLAAVALERGPRPKRAIARWIWLAAIAATVIVPGVFALRPPRAPLVSVELNSVGTLAVATPAAGNPAPPAGAPLPAPRILSRASRPALSVPAVSYSPPDTPALDRALLIAWLLASLAVAMRWVRSLLALRRERRTWRESEAGGTRVWVSRDVGPALFGIARPQVVLPEWALELDQRSLSLMLAHEAEHRRARDPMVLGASAVLGILVPWNVALWWQRARLRLAIEIDCDARVLKAQGDAREYASLLVAVGERMSPFTRIAPAFVEHRSLLARRIVAMGDAKRPRRAVQVVMAFCAAVVCVAIACGAPSPAKIAGGGRMPAELLAAVRAQPQFYPRVLLVDTVGAQSVAWLRAAVANSYPAVLTGDSSLMFVSLFVDERGNVVKALGQPRPTDLKPGEQIQRSMLPYFEGTYHYGGDSANKTRPDVVAERKLATGDETALAKAMGSPHPFMLGVRTVFPRAFDYDTTHAVPLFDAFLGTDPRAFQRDDDFYFRPGVIGPNRFEVHVLLFKPGRGTSADFGHRVSAETRERVRIIAPEDTASYSILGADAVAAITRCHPPTCRPWIRSGPGPGELSAGLDSGTATSGQKYWYAAADDAPRPSADWQSHDPAGWALTQETWDTLSHKPLLLVDGVPRTLKYMFALGDAVRDLKRLSPAEAMKLSHDPAAANGAIIVTTKR